MADSNGTYRSDDQYQYGKQPKLPARSIAPDYPDLDSVPARPEPTRAQMSRRVMDRFHAQKVEAEEWRDRKVDRSFKRTGPRGSGIV